MESPDDPGKGFPSKRAKTNPHSFHTMQCLIFVRGHLPIDVYNDFVQSMIEIRKAQSTADPDPDPEIRDISTEECKEMVLNLLDGHPRVIEAFQCFIQGFNPFHAELLTMAVNFLKRVKICSDISSENYAGLLTVIVKSQATNMTYTDVYEKVKESICHHPELVKEFENFLPYFLHNEQSWGTPKNSRLSKMVQSFTPDAKNKLDDKETNCRKEAPQLKYTQDQYQNHHGMYCSLRHKQDKRTTGLIESPREEGYDESPREELEDDDEEEHNAEPLHQCSYLRGEELLPKVDPSNCMPCTPSYCLLPKNCATLQSSYQTEVGRSVLNDSLVSVTTGTEDCFKFRTKNQYEENMFKCEDDLFESDMLLQRFRATVDFIEDLQERVGSNVKIQEHLTPLHKRCIEQLYDDSGIDMLDALSESENTSSALAVILSRLNQKIGDLSEARLSFNKICSDIIANNYHRSLDLCSPSFKQLDMKRMKPKALLAGGKQISKTKSHTDIHMHEDIGNIINHACSRSCTSEDEPMMNWTELVKAFLSVKFQWPDLKDRVALKKVCEHCGMSKDSLTNVRHIVPTNELVLSSKRVQSLRVKSNEPTSLLDRFDAVVEEGEFIPDVENIRLRVQCLPTNSSGHSTYGHWNGSEENYESKEDSNNEVGSSAYFGRTDKACDANRGISCCTLAVLCRLLQVMYERLLVAKHLSKGASIRYSYAEFKEKLCNLIDGSTDNWNFEQHCLKFLGPKSYVLFTLDKLIERVIKQICKIYRSHEDSSVLQQQDKLRTNSLNDPALLARRTNLSKELLHHQNARGYPIQPSIELLKQDREEGTGSKPHSDDAGKVKQNHFQRRRKRTLEKSAPSFSHLGPEKSSVHN